MCAGESLWRPYASHGAMRKDEDDDHLKSYNDRLLLETYDEIKTAKTKNTILTKTWNSILLVLPFAGGFPAEQNKECFSEWMFLRS